MNRINRAVADCIILCAYSQRPPRDAANDYLDSLRRDPSWDAGDVDTVESLVTGLFDRLQRTEVDNNEWLV